MTASVLTVTELARRWKVGRPSVLKAIADGRLPAFRVTAKAWRVRLVDVEAYEARRAA